MNRVNKIISHELRSHPKSVASLVVLIFLSVLFQAFTPWPFKLLIDNVLEKEQFAPGSFESHLFAFASSPLSLGFIVVFLYVLSTIFSALTEYATNVTLKSMSRSLIFDFSKKAFNYVTESPISKFRRTDIGDYVYRLSYDTSAIGEFFENGVVPLIFNGLYLVVVASILIIINPTLAALSFIMVPVLAAFVLYFNKRIGRTTRMSEYSNSALFGFIQETLNQLKIVQAFNQEQHEGASFQKKQSRALHDEVQMNHIQVALTLAIGIIIALGYALVISDGIIEVTEGRMTVGLLVIFIFYLDNFTGPLLSVAQALSSMKESTTKITHLSDTFFEQPETCAVGESIPLHSSDIVFKNVHVFGDDNVHILKDISVVIPKNKVTVIVGTNGSGKTTFISLLLRFMEISQGSIIMDDRDIRSYSLASLRNSIAYIPQEVELFDDTVKANILFGNPAASLPEIQYAARLAHADSFIKHLPNQYDFQVGEGGSKLSGGQRQRVLLARALLKKDAPFMILDEPFSSLDIKTYQSVIHSFPRMIKNKTVIIVSNVLQIIQQADVVVVLNNGKIVKAGSGTRLLKESEIAKLLLSIA